MKLYNVSIHDHYNASYEGDINTSYTRLVFASTEVEAVKFVNEELENWADDNGVAKTAIEVDSKKAKLKRNAQYYE
jgi:hypothetical protein